MTITLNQDCVAVAKFRRCSSTGETGAAGNELGLSQIWLSRRCASFGIGHSTA